VKTTKNIALIKFVLLLFLGLGVVPLHATTTLNASQTALRFEPLANVMHLGDDASALTGYSKLGTIEEVYVTENHLSKLKTVEIYKNADGVLAWRALAQAGDELVRGVSKSVFKASFTASDEIAEQAWIFFKNEDWTSLENLFNTHNLNGGWPPNNGFKNITHIETSAELSGKTFDRFQGYEDLGGRFASPVNSGEGVGDLVFTYDSRALNTQIQDGTYYIKFKLKNNLPSDLKFEYGETIPWFNTAGNAEQIKSSYNFGNLIEGVHYDIVEKFVFQNGQWVSIP